MKNKILLLIAFLFVTNILNAQVYNIFKTSKGEFKGLYELYDKDKDDIYGYISYTDLDKVDKRLHKLKYEILDKNFNKISSGEFIQPVYFKKGILEIKKVVYNKGHIMTLLNEFIYKTDGKKNIFDYYHIIDLSNGKITSKGTFNDAIIIKNDKVEKKKGELSPSLFGDLLYQTILAYPLDTVGFYISTKYPFNNSRIRKEFILNPDGTTLWKNKYRIRLPKDLKYLPHIIGIDDKHIYYIKNAGKGKNKKSIILAKDIKTGKIVSKTNFKGSDINYDYNIIDIDVLDGKLYFVGRYKDEKNSGKLWNGIYRTYFIVDKDNKMKQGKLEYLPFSKFGLKNMNKYGKIERKGFMLFVDLDMNPDGSIFLIGEVNKGKYRKGLYSFIIGKDFTMKKATEHNTDNTKYSKYYTSQNLFNHKGKAYVFYNDISKRLFDINFIKMYYGNNDVDVSTHKINLKKSIVKIHRAKAGYFMILEKFLKAKKGDKEFEFRLERIN
jgi:hypothetical protein